MNLELRRVGESRLKEGFRLRPFTALGIFLLATVFIGGLLAVFVFADTKEERWVRSLISVGAVGAAGTAFAAIVRREERSPFPLLARKALWFFVLLLAIGAFASTIYSFFVPIPGFRPGVALAVLAPGAVVAWRLLRDEK